MQQFFLKHGEVKRAVPLEKLVDDRFVDHAVKVLGRYKGR